MKSLAFALLLLFDSREQAAATTEPPARPFAISISGGLSLGAYQAGFLYYQTQMLRANRNLFRPWIMTGSSAGAINAFISLMEYCEASDRKPDESVFWSNWQNIGFKDLAPQPKQKVSPISLFTREALEKNADRIEDRWKQGLPKSCDTALGVTATLLNPETIDLSAGVSVQRQTMRFVFRIRGRGPGKSPSIENYVDDSQSSLSPQLYLDPDPERRYAQVRELVLASAAFPGAFDPIAIRFCRSHRGIACTMETSEVQDFVDGGIFENQPLRLALQVARQSLVIDEQGRASLLDVPKLNRVGPSFDSLQNINVYHIDTDAHGYPTVTAQERPEDSRRFLIHALDFGLNFVSSARSRELYSLLEEDPDIRAHIVSDVTYFPRASEPWAAFFGFFDAGFRRFDFLLGVANAQRDFAELHKRFPRLVRPEIMNHQGPLSEELVCVDAFTNPDGITAVPSFCRASSMKNTRAIAQAGWSRLTEACLQKPPSAHERSVYHSCRSPWLNQRPEWTDPSYAQLPWEKESLDQDDGIHLLRLLGQYGYQFEPAEFTSETDPPEQQVATKVHDLAVALADRQPFNDRDAIAAVSERIADQIHYLPPTRALYVTVGDLSEFGIFNKHFGAVSLPGSLRMGAVVQTYRFLDLFQTNQGAFSVAPMLGLEADIMHFRNSAVIKGALRAGYIYAAGDTWGHETCQSFGPGFLDTCSGWTVQPALVLTFIERVRFELVYRTLLAGAAHQMSSEAGVQLGFQFPF